MAGFGTNDTVVATAPQPFGANDDVVEAPPSGFGVNDTVIPNDGPGVFTPIKAFGRGAGEGAGAVVSGAGVLVAAKQAEVLKAFDEIDAGKPVSTWEHLTFPEASIYANADPDRRARIRHAVSEATGQSIQQAGQSVTSATQNAIPLTPGEQASYWAKAPEMVGFGLPAVGAMVATKGAGAGPVLAAGAGIMGLQGADQGFQDAIAHGASLDDAYKAAYGSAAIQGGLGALPVGHVLEKLDTATGGTFRRMISAAVTQGGTQAVIGAVQQALTNLQAKGLYDPERGLAEGVGEAAILGAFAGAGTGGTLAALPGGARVAETPGAKPGAESTARPVSEPAAEAPPPAPPPTPSPIDLNQPVGLKTPSGVIRVVPEAIDGGNVIYRAEDGSMRGATLEQFQRDLAEPPAPTVRPDNATTIPEPPPEFARTMEEAPPPGVDDLNDFNPWAEEPSPPREPPAPKPQQTMDLPDMTAADAIAKRVAGIEAEIAKAEAGINPKTPEQLKVMRQVATELQDQAAGMLSRTTAAHTGPEGSIAEPTPLGRLSVASRGLETEATTGRSLTEPVGSPAKRAVLEELQAKEPLLQAKPAVSEATRPLVPLETDAGKLLPMSRAVGAETEASRPPEMAPPSAKVFPTIQDLIAKREAILNNPEKLARQLGVTADEAKALLQREVGRPGTGIRQIKGSITKDKTGKVTQSKMAGRYTYGVAERAPQNMLEHLARAGGVRDEGGDMAAMGADRWHVGKPGVRKLVNSKGMSNDELADWMVDNDYLPKPQADERNAENYHADQRDALAVVERALAGKDASVAPRQTEFDADYQRDYTVRRDLERLGEQVNPEHSIEDLESQLGERLAMMDAATVEDAVRVFDEEAARELRAVSDEARQAVEEVSNGDNWADAEADRIAGDRSDAARPAEIARSPAGDAEAGPVSEGEGRVEGAVPDAAADERGAAGEGEPRISEPPLATERTAQGDQTVIPGAERSARQAMAAQPERLRADVPQKAADEGLFGDGHKQKGFWGDEAGAADPLWFLNLGKAIKVRAAERATTKESDIGREAAALARETKPGHATSLNPANAFMTMPAALASRDAPSGHYFNSLLDQHRTAERMENDAIPKVVPYLGLNEKAQARVDKVLEYARLYGHDLADDGRNVVIMVPKTRTAEGAAHPELSRPGEVIALDAKETAAFHQLREFFTDRLRQMGEAIARESGYEGPFEEAALKSAAVDASASAGARKAADRALNIWNETVGAGRKGYVPFSRYGDKYIKITPKVGTEPGKDAMPARLEDGWFEFVAESKLGNKIGQSALRDRIAELRKRFPQEKFDLTAGDVADIKQQTDTLNIPALERIIARMDKGEEAAGAVDAVMKHVFDQRRAGFRKQAANIPGYSTDFSRAIVDYVRHSSAMIARLEHRKTVDAAFDATQSHRAPGIADYWKQHKAYMESNGGDFGSLRKVAFYQYLWGSPASAAVNLTQTGLVTAPQLAAWTGPRAAPMLIDAMRETGAGVRIGSHGLEMDWSKIGRTPAERAMIGRMVKEGTLNPVLAREFEGTSQMASKRLRPYSKRLSQVWEIGASGFNVAEQINRATAALAYFRAANNPALLRNLIKMHAEDTRFQDLMRGGMTPEKAAQWGVDETQFIGGKINRAPMQRGVGGLALQMRTYQLNTLRLMYKNMTRLGPQGKIAAALMGGALVATSGLYGLPFAEDADKLATAMSKWWNGIDPMAEMRIREFISDEAMNVFGADSKIAQWLAEATTRGTLRSTGVDIGPRIGMGNVVPDGSMWSTIPILSATVERGQQFWQAVKNGEPMSAAAQVAGFLGGKPAQDVTQAAALVSEGKRTMAGDIVVPPSEITAGEVAARATGFNPTEFARKTERRYQEGRLAASTQAASSNMLRSAATHFALAEDAGKSGDVKKQRMELAAFNRILAENAERLNDPDIPEWQQLPMPTRQALKSAIGRQMDYDQSVAKRTGKMKRDQLNDLQQLFGP